MDIQLYLVLFYVFAGLVVNYTLAQNGLCPAPNGDFPNPSSELCTTFFRCVQGIPSLLCPANQRFDFLFRFCRDEESVDCRSQLQVFAAPPLLNGIGGISSGLFPLAGTGSVGGLGAISGLGAGLPEGGLISLLNQLDGNANDGQNGNNQLATLLMMSALMKQMNSANQQEPAVGSFPISNLYPDNSRTSLNSFTGQGPLVTNQNYQHSDDVYGRQDASTNPDNGLSLGNGKTFIFLPQYQPSPGQVHLPQGQGQTVSAGTATDVGDLGQTGVIQGTAQQDQGSFQDPGNSSGQGNLPVQNRPRGQFSGRNQNSPPGRRFPRRRGQGQRRNIQGPLPDSPPHTTDSPVLNIDSTLGSVGFVGTA